MNRIRRVFLDLAKGRAGRVGIAATAVMALAGGSLLSATTAVASVVPSEPDEALLPGISTRAGCFPSNPDKWTFDKPSGTVYDDTTVATYVGENAAYHNHEVEGLQVVQKQTTVQKQMPGTSFNMGIVGVGAQNRPPDGELMFATGEKLTVKRMANNIDEKITVWMGIGVYAGGPFLGGFYDPANNWKNSYNGATVTNSDGVAFDDQVKNKPKELTEFAPQLEETGDFLGKVSTTGTAAFDASGKILTLTGTNSDALEKFDIDGSKLPGVTTIKVNDVKPAATLVLNVTGKSIKLFQSNTLPAGSPTASGEYAWHVNGGAQIPVKGSGLPLTEDDYTADWAALTQRVLWYFPEATDVQMGLNPAEQMVDGKRVLDTFKWNANARAYLTEASVLHGQFLGSIFIPNGSLKSNFTTNGRVYVGEDLTMWGGDPSDKTGRAEMHSFPLHLPGYECSEEVDKNGSFAVKKSIVDTEGNDISGDFEDYVFDVKATFVYPDGKGTGLPKESTLSVKSDGKLVTGPLQLPLGTKVTLTEPTIHESGPQEAWSFDDAKFIDEKGKAHEPPYTFTIDKATAEGAKIAEITLQNTYKETTGTFSISKALSGIEQDQFPEGTVFEVVATWVVDGKLESGILQVPVDGTPVRGPNLPNGTIVTIDEVRIPSVPGFEWDHVDFSPSEVVIENDSNMIVVAKNTYTKADTGSFTLKKVVRDTEGQPVPGAEDLTFGVIAQWTEGRLDHSQEFELPGDGTAVQGPELPVGTVVKFDEIKTPDIDGYVFSHPEINPDEIVIGKDESPSVTVTNVYREKEESTFLVQKVATGVTDPRLLDGRGFTIEASWEIGGVEDSANITIPATGDAFESGISLPDGTVVTFDEIQVPELPGHEWTGVTFEPTSITVKEGEVLTVTATNAYEEVEKEMGTYSVSKLVEGVSASAFPEGTVFEVLATWDIGGERYYEVLEAPVTGEAVVSEYELPTGTEVRFEEISAPTVDGYEWTDVSLSDESITIGKGETAQVVATNHYDRIVGGFSLEKALDGVAVSDFPDGTTFDVTASWSIDGESTTHTFNLPVDGTVVQGPQDLPEGTIVDFEEVAPPVVDGYEFQDVFFSPTSVTIAAEQDMVVTATNTYSSEEVDNGYGGFSLQKAFDGITETEFPAGTTFEVTASWSIDDQSANQTFNLPVDGTVVKGPQDLPEGTVVTFTEPKAPEVEGYTWDGVRFSPQSLVVSDGQNPVVTATNTYSPEEVEKGHGGFTLNKALEGIKPGKFPTGTTFEVTASWSVDGESVSKTFDLPVDGAVVKGPLDLPEGTVVTFTEAKAPEVEGYDWKGVSFSPDKVTISDGQVLKVTATNEYTSGKLVTTGANGTWIVLASGIVLLLGGVGAYAVSRQRKA